MTSDDRLTSGLILDVLNVLERHGYHSYDNRHTGQAIGAILDLAYVYDGSPAWRSRLRDAQAYDQMAAQMLQAAAVAPAAHHGQAEPARPARPSGLVASKEAGQ